jgi:hypothetical protein
MPFILALALQRGKRFFPKAGVEVESPLIYFSRF